VKSSERTIFNRGYGQDDILPNRDLLDLLLSDRENWIDRQVSLVPSGMTVLDVGCGSGATSISLAKRGFHVTGIDISDERISTARSNAEKMDLEIKFVVGDIEEMATTNEDYDVISCTAILHHLPDLERDLDSFSSMMKEGGFIIATEPGLLNPFAFLRRRFFPTSVHTPDEHPFVPFRLIRMFKSRYRKVEYEYFYILSLAALIFEKLLGEKVGYISLRILRRVDAVLTKIPVVRELSWIINIRAEK
jgi:2-polyprenyl-3-methyl-5-hydroxy-6-metoxy-1,4-benzoquinol methylase